MNNMNYCIENEIICFFYRTNQRSTMSLLSVKSPKHKFVLKIKINLAYTLISNVLAFYTECNNK